MSIFEELRALDDIDALRALRFADSGIPMWPFVRWFATSSVLDRTHGLQAPFATGRRRGASELVRMVSRALVRSPFAVRRPFDLVIASSSGGLVIQQEGRWFDRINDYFALEFPERTLVLDGLLHGGGKSPRAARHVRYFDTFDVLAGLAARVRRPSGADASTIERLLGILGDRAVPGDVLDGIRAQLLSWAVRIPTLRGLYARFFDRVRPRAILLEDASHGALSHVCTWARAAGIAVAEPQHGIISRSHLAYNYGDTVATDDAFVRCLPTHVMVYGEFWRDQVRTPSPIEVIGFPHFSAMARARSATSDTVLVISQGICTDIMVRLTAAIARSFPARGCVIRLHPGEAAFPERWSSLTAIPNVEISQRGDIYEQLSAAGIVVGYSSMALVEAAGMGLPVLVFDDDTTRAYLPAAVGTRFRSVDELIPLIATPPAAPIDPERFFARDWRDRYRAFVSRVAP